MSISFKQVSQAALDRAIAKAKALKPRVRINGYNDFTVTGSKGDKYAVKFSGKGEDFTGHCQCVGNQKEHICYHVVAVAPIFKGQVNERASARYAVIRQAGTEETEVARLEDPIEADNTAQDLEAGDEKSSYFVIDTQSDEPEYHGPVGHPTTVRFACVNYDLAPMTWLELDELQERVERDGCDLYNRYGKGKLSNTDYQKYNAANLAVLGSIQAQKAALLDDSDYVLESLDYERQVA